MLQTFAVDAGNNKSGTDSKRGSGSLFVAQNKKTNHPPLLDFVVRVYLQEEKKGWLT